MTIEEKIDKLYDELFDFVCELDGIDEFHDIVVEFKGYADGKTIRRSWRDREETLKGNDEI